jgi:hypothetical protein
MEILILHSIYSFLGFIAEFLSGTKKLIIRAKIIEIDFIITYFF